MSTTTAPAITRAGSPQPGENPQRLSFPRLVRSEWIKFSTLRSPWWSIGIVALVSVGLSLLVASSMSGFIEAGSLSAADASAQAVQVVLAPTSFTVLLAAVLGAISITGEYSTGMIRSTLTAAPGRLGSLFAKAVVVGGFMFVSSLVIFTVAAVATAPLLSDSGIALDLADPENSLVPILFGSLTLTAIALLGLACGFLLRNGPGAIATAVGLVFVLPLVPAFFPVGVEGWEWIHDLAQYLPTNAGQSLMIPGAGPGLDTIPALLTLVAWVLAGLAGAAAVLKTRDA
ncbi:ABC transporter permease [Microbacterium sp. CFBP9034]|uniref:ABC transporter permease n=1 Tax=Microbacterium sp. CFBP9034 TaxID=3096540 RepID=UPI002A6A2A1D|nr:ABC transporter permease [Microbacterium sp. CFBP9034]MDY0909573.1 ABC transporter permease [Microbacterium sp. CFBP9034]